MTYSKPTSISSHVIIALVALILGSTGTCFSDPGDPVPAFDLIDLAGNRHTAGDYDGHILVLFFVGHN